MKLVSLLVLLIPTTVWAERVDFTAEGEPDFMEREKCLDDGGWVGIINSNDTMTYECEQGHGILHGQYRLVDNKTHVLLKDANFREHTIHGYYREWYVNEQIKIQGNYVFNKRIGLWSYWNKDGCLLRDDIYDQRGRLLKRVKYKCPKNVKPSDPARGNP